MLRLNSVTKTAARQFSSSAKANSFARAQLLGRIGNDLVETEAANGTKFVRYPIAVQPKKDGPVSWFNIISFNEGQNRFLTEYVRKGALVHVDASLKHEVYEKEDGTKIPTTTFFQNRIELIQNPRVEEESE